MTYKNIIWIEAVCQICYQKFLFIEGHEQPKTCHKFECLSKYHMKGVDKISKFSAFMSTNVLTDK